MLVVEHPYINKMNQPQPFGYARGKPFGCAHGERRAAVIALLDEWLADESGYDDRAWAGLCTALEDHMNTADIFAGMRQHQFTRNAFARDKRGFPIQPTSADAVRWDAEGWLWQYANDLEIDRRLVLYHRNQIDGVARKIGYATAAEANDDLGWHFIEAIRDAEPLQPTKGIYESA